MTTRSEPDTCELSLWDAMRAGAGAMSDQFVRFAIGNLVWLAVVGAALLVGRVYVPGNVLLVLGVGASCGLCRMAACTIRGKPAVLTEMRTGLAQRGWTGFGFGCLQLVIVAVAATNITIAVQTPRLPMILSAVVSGYAGVFVAATILVAWPLLLDPDREQMAIGQVVRLGLVVIAARPGRHLALVILEAFLVAVGLQTFVAALVLPAFGLLVACWVVLPLADDLTR